LDHANRYLLIPDGGSERAPHRRVTTLARTIEDTYGLERWNRRKLADGLAKRADLVASVAAARGNDKRLNEICDQAIEAAGASSSANLGTALHSFAEQVDRGELSIDDVDEPWARDVLAYRSALEDNEFTVELVEEIVVLPGLGVAGTVDRVVEHRGHRYVLDLKTGKDLKFGWPAMAAQLACYAHAATIYNDKDDTHRPMLDDVSQELGIIAHIPAGQGTCELIGVDLEVGWRGAQLAHTVLEYRKAGFRRKWGLDANVERREWLVRQVRRLMDDFPAAAADLATFWPVDVPTLRQDGHTSEQLDQIAAALQRIEGVHGVPFSDEPDPAHAMSRGMRGEHT
jgi:hypothetical protein